MMCLCHDVSCLCQDLDDEDDLPPHPKPHAARRLMDPDTRSIDSDDYQDFESYQSQQLKGNGNGNGGSNDNGGSVSGKDQQQPPVAAPASVTCQSFQLFLRYFQFCVEPVSEVFLFNAVI